MKKIKLYWWRGDGAEDPSKQNFGDYLSPMIVEVLSGKKVIHSHPKHADMIAIGTILPVEKKAKGLFFKRKLHIWGSGTDRKNRILSGHHYYHAVRGSRSLEQIKGDKSSICLGDPGLLSDRLLAPKNSPKKYSLGIIPHYVDQADPRVSLLLESKHAKLINVFDPVNQVLSQIQDCELILSSSMHGLIVADSFGIPNRRLLLSQGIISDYKFDDYYSAFGLPDPEPMTPEKILSGKFNIHNIADNYSRPGLDKIKSALETSFPSSL